MRDGLAAALLLASSSASSTELCGLPEGAISLWGFAAIGTYDLTESNEPLGSFYFAWAVDECDQESHDTPESCLVFDHDPFVQDPFDMLERAKREHESRAIVALRVVAGPGPAAEFGFPNTEGYLRLPGSEAVRFSGADFICENGS